MMLHNGQQEAVDQNGFVTRDSHFIVFINPEDQNDRITTFLTVDLYRYLSMLVLYYHFWPSPTWRLFIEIIAFQCYGWWELRENALFESTIAGWMVQPPTSRKHWRELHRHDQQKKNDIQPCTLAWRGYHFGVLATILHCPKARLRVARQCTENKNGVNTILVRGRLWLCCQNGLHG